MKKINIRDLIIALCTVAIVWLISGILTASSMESYNELIKPFLDPPGYVFAVVWPVLYLLMGISFYIIISSGENNKDAINIFMLQLLFNLFWPMLFFLFEYYLFSSAWLLVLIFLIGYTIFKFSKISKKSSILLIPYFFWCLFALYLNFSIYLLN